MISDDELYPTGYRKYTLSSINHLSSPNENLMNIVCLEDNLESLGYDTTDQDNKELKRY